MRRRKLRWLLVGLAVLVSAGVVAMRTEPPSRITPENFARIRAGMTRVEVEAILGPPGDYLTGPIDLDFSTPWPTWNPSSTRVNWIAERGSGVVAFDASGRVETTAFRDGKRSKKGLLDNLLWRAGHFWYHRLRCSWP